MHTQQKALRYLGFPEAMVSKSIQIMNETSKMDNGRKDVQHRQENKIKHNFKMDGGDKYLPWCFFLSPPLYASKY